MEFVHDDAVDLGALAAAVAVFALWLATVGPAARAVAGLLLEVPRATPASFPVGVRAEESVVIHCEAPDDALLLVDWLNALIYEMATRRMLFGTWHVELDDHSLTARVSGASSLT